MECCDFSSVITIDKLNQKWCTDFTYLFLKNHEVRYNCSIIDLYDRSIIASITDKHITSELAIHTLQKALDSQKICKEGLILHSDWGTQYTFKAFTEFCETAHIKKLEHNKNTNLALKQLIEIALEKGIITEEDLNEIEQKKNVSC